MTTAKKTMMSNTIPANLMLSTGNVTSATRKVTIAPMIAPKIVCFMKYPPSSHDVCLTPDCYVWLVSNILYILNKR